MRVWKRPDNPWGRYRQQYLYRCPKISCRGQAVEPGWLPAAAAIDWTLRGTRIGDRDRPLKPKTRRRIAAGIARYWTPPQLEAAGHTYDAADPHHIRYGDPNAYYRAWPVDQPMRTIRTTASQALAVPVEGRAGTAAPVDVPLRTMTTRAETALVAPFIAELRGGGSTARPVEEPLATVTASGFHHGLVSPPAMSPPTYGAGAAASATDQPGGTQRGGDRYALVVRNNGTDGNLSWASTPTHEVLRTLTTKGQQALLTPGDLEAAEVRVDDCEFRMLEPAETAAGMSFPTSYRWEGTRRERQKLAGNAVTPPAARDLIGCAVEALTGSLR